MKATFTTTKQGTWAYICKSVRINGKSTSERVKKLGLLSDIKEKYGCEDPRQWVIDLARKMTIEEKAKNAELELTFHPNESLPYGDRPLRIGGDLLLLPLYTKLGLPEICSGIMNSTRAKYDLNEIMRTLILGRILYPGSKKRTLEMSQSLIEVPGFSEEDMFRSLSLISEHIDQIQAQVYLNSKKVIERRERVIYYDCTNYFFEIEDNDKDIIDEETGEFIPGLRKKGKSKENRPNPIVQMGMFMDMDGIPLAFVIFPGNESEQTTLQPLEEKLNRKFGMTDYVVSTDCGLSSESNRRYNMAEGRDYICVQSLPKLKEKDRNMAIDAKGWHISYCKDSERREKLEQEWSQDGIFNLQDILGFGKDEVEKEPDEYLKKEKELARQNTIAGLLREVTFYKEIIVTKEIQEENPEWLRQKKIDPKATPADKDGNEIPHHHVLKRDERIIVTYSHDFALYLRHKRALRKNISEIIVKSKKKKTRQSQQSPMKYVKTTYYTKSGEKAAKVDFAIDEELIAQEEKLDGYYAYGTSLDDDGVDVLKIRSFHHEIEHLFRTTKTHLDARPVYLSRQDRIKSHFLICFLSMVILKILQKQIIEANEEAYKAEPLTIDALIKTLRNIKFGKLPGNHYMPMFERTELTEHLQNLCNLNICTQLINAQKMRIMYKSVKKR